MLAFATHVTLVLGCFNIKISANWHTIEKSALCHTMLTSLIYK